MRKVVAYELLSLDGVAEEPNQFIADWDEAMAENLARVIGTQDAVLLGRQNWEEWADFWQTSNIEPFATFINGVHKYVATSTAPTREWPDTTVVDRDLAKFVADLRQQPGGDIGLHGSISVVQSLLEAGLVDALSVVIAPAVHGHGRKLLDGVSARRLSLTRAVTSPTGYLLLDYELS
jgi:dihydrofolate reductase